MASTFSLYTLCVITIITRAMDWGNEFDTYNVDECGKRVRRNWWTLTEDEQQNYIEGLIQLRANGFNGLQSNETDEFHHIAKVHVDTFGGLVHETSMFFWWHSYVLWELESRIRNLGGEWKCFAMPYWDFWTTNRVHEAEHGYLFQKAMGGNGNEDDAWTVTEDWPWTTEQFWVPHHCNAAGDVKPLCSFKRALGDWTQLSWPETGRIFTENPSLIDMQELFVNYQGKTLMVNKLFAHADTMQSPTTSSYDPVWYLFHSMISYQQYMWQDCNDYDLVDPEDLDDNHYAYTDFLTQDESNLIENGINPSMALDEKLYFADSLQNAEWSFINQSKLTVRKLYHLHRWNVIYDLGDGSGFYEDSGFQDYCGDKLNPYWFMLTESPKAEEEYHGEDEDGSLTEEDEEETETERAEYVDGHLVHSVSPYTAETTFGAMVFLVVGFAVISLLRRCGVEIRKKDGFKELRDSEYGTV